MNVAIRYYSRGGHVKMMAEAISRGTGVEVISIDDPDSAIVEHTDLLFIGGALYNFQIDPKLKKWIEDIPEGMVEEAIIFGSSWLTRRPVLLMQDYLKARGIKINKQSIWSRNRPNDDLIEVIEYFAKNELVRDRSLDGLPPYLIFKRSQEIKAAKEAAKAEGREYVPEQDLEFEAKRHQREADEAQAQAEAAQQAALEAQKAAEAAAKEAAEAARIAQEKADAAAQAQAALETDLHEDDSAVADEENSVVVDEEVQA